MYKALEHFPRSFEKVNFCGKIGYDFLRHQNTFRGPLLNSIHNGNEGFSFVESKIWEMIPENI